MKIKPSKRFTRTEVLRYAILCNLIETIWARSRDKDFYNIDFHDLLPMTSPQARRIATFIEELYTNPLVNLGEFVGKL